MAGQNHLEELIKTAQCTYIFSHSFHDGNCFLHDYYNVLYQDKTGQITREQTSDVYVAGGSLPYVSSVSYYQSISAEDVEEYINKTAQIDTVKPKYEGLLIRVLKTSLREWSAAEAELTRDSLLAVEGKYVLHRLNVASVIDDRGRREAHISEIVWAIHTDSISEITPKNYEQFRVGKPIFVDTYIEYKDFSDKLKNSFPDIGTRILSDISRTHTARESKHQSDVLKNVIHLMDIVKEEGLSIQICYQEKQKRGFVFDCAQQPNKVIMRKLSETCWDVYCKAGSATDIRNIRTSQEACEKALEYARAAKNPSDESGSYRFLAWTLDDAGTLTLYGNGPMPSVEVPERGIHDWQIGAVWGDILDEGSDEKIMDTIPWDGPKVQRVVIEAGLTSISHKAFFSGFSQCVNGHFVRGNYDALREIILPDTMETLESYSVYHCRALEKVVIPASVVNIHEDNFNTIFSSCPNLVFLPQRTPMRQVLLRRMVLG